MSELLNKEEKVLLNLLSRALGSRRVSQYQGCDWNRVAELAQAHAVLAVLYDVLEGQPDISPALWERIQRNSRITVQSNYRLLFLTKFLTEKLQKAGIRAVTLKGAATASFYPVPEYRKSGDIDLLLTEQADVEKACRLLEAEGFVRVGSQTALHHTELCSEEGIMIELHGMLAEPFEDHRINAYLARLLPQYGRHIIKNTSWGVELYQPSDAYHAFYLVLHMLQHFLREGFGLKNLCDWTVFWDREVDQKEKERFLKLVDQSGTGQFVRVLTAACVRYLGLPRERAAFILTEPVQKAVVQAFLRDVLDAGEFGRSEGDRMVAMRGTGIAAYIQEFQHQMHLNYPRAGRVILCWPALWGLTLMRFLENNKRLHRAPVRSILKKAGRRSTLIARMRLFDILDCKRKGFPI